MVTAFLSKKTRVELLKFTYVIVIIACKGLNASAFVEKAVSRSREIFAVAFSRDFSKQRTDVWCDLRASFCKKAASRSHQSVAIVFSRDFSE